MAKGQSYEREIAKQLSLWWTNGDRDDAFWRSSQSGGRATTRAKAGKKTSNACGDLCAQDAEGQKFLDIFTIELKRGYAAYTISDLIEGGNTGMNKFVAQAAKAASLAGTPYWLLIHKRDRRPALVLTNANMPLRLNYTSIDYDNGFIHCCLLENFLSLDTRAVDWTL